MADPEIPEVRAEMQREESRGPVAHKPSLAARGVLWSVFAVAVVAVIALAYAIA